MQSYFYRRLHHTCSVVVTDDAVQPMAWGPVLTLLKQVAAGLAVLHDCGIVHRDVRAENVFISSRDPLTVKIGDLGLSHVLASASSSCSVSKITDGPIAWMSPEALAGKDESMDSEVTASQQVVSKRGDVYMLGGMIHEVLTGEHTG